MSEHPGLCGTRCSSHFKVTYSRDPCGSCSARIQFRIAIFSQSSEREGSQVGVCLDRGLKEQQRQFIIFSLREEGQGQQEGKVSLSVTPTSGWGTRREDLWLQTLRGVQDAIVVYSRVCPVKVFGAACLKFTYTVRWACHLAAQSFQSLKSIGPSHPVTKWPQEASVSTALIRWAEIRELKQWRIKKPCLS